MNTRYAFSVKQRKAMDEVCKSIVDKQMDDVSKRCQYLWAAAMLECDYTADDINRVIAKLPQVTEFYEHYTTDKLGDYVMHSRLMKYGIDIGMTEDEK